jgi:tetratricopeptide (TPR) repeat protein
VEPTLPQHDETIVPVRPGLGAGTAVRSAVEAAQDRSASRRRALAAIAGSVVVLVTAAAVFVWLPRHQADVSAARAQAAAAAARAAQTTAPTESLSPQEAAALKSRAEALLAALLTQQNRLDAQNVASWGGDSWQRYETLQRAGEDAFLANDFRAAVKSYTDASELGEDLVKRAGQTVEGALTAAAAAFTAGNVDLAIKQYDIVLGIDPSHAVAKAGRARAERLPQVLALVRRADEQRANGELEEAVASYREALVIDSGWEPARTAVDEITKTIRENEYDQRMSAGSSALAAENFDEAEKQFRMALKLRPTAVEAKDGVTQAEEGAKLDKIALAQARGFAFEKRELWDQAIAQYRAVLETDSTVLFAQTGLDRATSRAGLDAKLANLIEHPTLLFGDTTLASARELLDVAGEIPEKGPRLGKQIEDLGRLVTLATTPIRVQLESDQLTDVTLYRVGALGAFVSKEVELRPGTYTAIGSRDGYRDVRRTFTVVPGRALSPISVICVEQI